MFHWKIHHSGNTAVIFSLVKILMTSPISCLNMVACRNGISLLAFNFISHSFAALNCEISSLTPEQIFHIYARPCIILYTVPPFGGIAQKARKYWTNRALKADKIAEKMGCFSSKHVAELLTSRTAQAPAARWSTALSRLGQKCKSLYENIYEPFWEI